MWDFLPGCADLAAPVWCCFVNCEQDLALVLLRPAGMSSDQFAERSTAHQYSSLLLFFSFCNLALLYVCSMIETVFDVRQAFKFPSLI